MTPILENTKILLHTTQKIADHQEEIKKLRGESFNVFSILKMESRENETHSAFLGELLNPKGTHLKGYLFLNLFLESIGYKGPLNTGKAKVTLEKNIGTRNDKLKIGGRVDIYISDDKGNCICIENKIYAGDQDCQVERYINHNKDYNRVYYLTLKGELPSENSKGALKEGEDFFCISYRQTILEWLEKCIKESFEQPILRESIRQYIILIKKMTNQLSDSRMEKEVEDLIKNNYHSAKTIAERIWAVELHAAHDLLNDMKTILQQELGDGWRITVPENLNQPWSGLEISFKDWNGVIVKLEAESRIPWNISYYGILASEDRYDRNLLYEKISGIDFVNPPDYQKTKAWPCYRKIMSLASTDDRARLFNVKERREILQEVTTALIALAHSCQVPLSGMPNKTSSAKS